MSAGTDHSAVDMPIIVEYASLLHRLLDAFYRSKMHNSYWISTPHLTPSFSVPADIPEWSIL
jgi:hypothetical protein